MALDFIEKVATESGEFTGYYKGSRILKSLDEIRYESFVRFMLDKACEYCIDDLLLSPRHESRRTLVSLSLLIY